MQHLPTFRDDGWALESFRTKAARLGRRAFWVATGGLGVVIVVLAAISLVAAGVVRMLANGDR